jgi:hypothetical protein
MSTIRGDTMTDPSSFTKLVPGFDFLQSLVKNAGAALPGIGQWVAPTIDPAEIEKRIEELRTVQFWLEQNARMLGATIQAMEVQRMTLSTLKTMNVQMEDLRDSLQIRVPSPAAEPAPATVPAAKAVVERVPSPPPAADEKALPPVASSNPGVVDPLQWWGALTKQFTELATTAMKDTASDAARNLAGAMVKKSFDGASKAAPVPSKAVGKSVAKKAAKKAAPKRGPTAP